MCNFKVLEYNPTGYVMRCQDCGHLQMAFGNVVLNLVEEDFWSFKELISINAEKNNTADNSPETTCIYIDTPCRNMKLLFSLNEIKNVAKLLEEAALLLQINLLLET